MAEQTEFQPRSIYFECVWFLTAIKVNITVQTTHPFIHQKQIAAKPFIPHFNLDLFENWNM